MALYKNPDYERFWLRKLKKVITASPGDLWLFVNGGGTPRHAQERRTACYDAQRRSRSGLRAGDDHGNRNRRMGLVIFFFLERR